MTLASETSPASSLATVQTFLQSAFRLPGEIPGNVAVEPQVREHITGNERVSPSEQADIYRRQYFLRHVDALLEDHAGLTHYLGEDPFERLCRAYLAEHPPRSYTLRDLGADLATFVARWDGMPPDLRPICFDMARYELCIVATFDAEDVPMPDGARLMAIPSEHWLTKRLLFTPLLSLHQFHYPVPELRRAIIKAGTEEGLMVPPVLPPQPSPCYYGIFRRDDTIAYETLSAEAHALLTLLLHGKPLAAACEDLSRNLSTEAFASLEADVSFWFQKWASWGWILGVADSEEGS